MSDPRGRRPLLPTLIAIILALSACRDTGGEGEYFEITGRLFIFNYRVARATYLVVLMPLKPMREGETAVATFENPAGGEPIVVRQKIWPKLEKTSIESPPLRCIVKDKPYAVTIRIERADGTVIQTIETTMASSQDQDVLPDRPLVIGPFYTPNPELADHPDGRLPDAEEEPCPPTP